MKWIVDSFGHMDGTAQKVWGHVTVFFFRVEFLVTIDGNFTSIDIKMSSDLVRFNFG